MTPTFFEETLPEKTAKLVQRIQLALPDFLKDFYLSGGTALSLQLGHRESEDLNFFSRQSFEPERLQENLLIMGTLEQTELASGTLNTFLDGVKLQFLEYPYDLLEPTIDMRAIQLSAVADIACTKLQTIGMRGHKKDFIDLYFVLQRHSLGELFKLLERKYVNINYSQTHILKSLVFFDDADGQPMPKMHRDVRWEAVKDSIIDHVRKIRF